MARKCAALALQPQSGGRIHVFTSTKNYPRSRFGHVAGRTQDWRFPRRRFHNEFRHQESCSDLSTGSVRQRSENERGLGEFAGDLVSRPGVGAYDLRDGTNQTEPHSLLRHSIIVEVGP